jgi:hypothetical protein
MLSEMLSQLLVAYTIEYDNEFEHHMRPRRRTPPIPRRGAVAGAAWARCCCSALGGRSSVGPGLSL